LQPLGIPNKGSLRLARRIAIEGLSDLEQSSFYEQLIYSNGVQESRSQYNGYTKPAHQGREKETCK
jgi:hypothetical protein